MNNEQAAANVSRSYQLAASSITIFTFLLFFLYPKYTEGRIDAISYQAILILMGVATFSFAFASFFYYGASLGGQLEDHDRARLSRRGDHAWLSGCVLMFLTPSLILLTIGLPIAASGWFALWLVYLLLAGRHFPRIRTATKQ